MMSAELPSLRHLRMFEAVARLESLSQAASELHRSQPAITQGIAKLERMMGVVLLERRQTGSYVTELGRLLEFRTGRLLTQIEGAFEALQPKPTPGDAARLRTMQTKVKSSHVRALVAIRELGSSERAARSVGVAPGSLVRIVRELEQICGRRLVQHTASGASLTRQAGELARRLNLALREIDHAREEIAAANGMAAATILVGAIPQCATRILTAAVDAFLRRMPGAHVRIESGPYDHLLNDLRSGRIDILFGVLRKPEWAGDVVERRLFDDPYAIVVRNGHPLTRKRKLQLEDLAGYDWILPRPGTPRRRSFERLFEGLAAPPASHVETSSLELQVALIEQSDRITLITAQEARRIESRGIVVTLDSGSGLNRRTDGFAMRADWHPTAAQLEFMRILTQESTRIVHSPARTQASEGARIGADAGPAAARGLRSRIDRVRRAKADRPA